MILTVDIGNSSISFGLFAADGAADSALLFQSKITADVTKTADEYAVLLPTDDDDGQVVILQFEAGDPDSDEESFGSVDDPVTLQAVFEIFKEKFKDQFDFEG